MPFIEKRYLARTKWREMNRRTHADDETADSLLVGTADAWKNGSVVVGTSISTEPTLSEFFALNQMTEPFTKLVAKYNGPQKAACGFISIANALVLCDVISQNKLWDRALASDQEKQQLLDAVCNPDLVMPRVENALHFAATHRVNYILNSAQASPSLRSSASQQNNFLSNWAAPFEISDCVRAILKKHQEGNDVLISADEAKEKKSPFGPSPFSLSKNNTSSSSWASLPIVTSISNLMFMRTNLYPIRDTAKELHRIRIEQEDKQFGGTSLGGAMIKYAEGDSAYFVDLLASDVLQQQENSSSTSPPSPLSNTKFISPRNLLDKLQRVNAAASPSHACSRGCRVYIIDVIGHFCVLLCYIDASGCPHGIVINSASGDLSDMHRKPTVRVAFDLYVANLTDSFRNDNKINNKCKDDDDDDYEGGVLTQEDDDGAQNKKKKNGEEGKKETSGHRKEDAINVDED